MSDAKVITNNRLSLLKAIDAYGSSSRRGERAHLWEMIQRMIAEPPRGTRLILVADDLLEHMGQYTKDGGRITVEWGPLQPGGWYEPTFTRHDPEEPT